MRVTYCIVHTGERAMPAHQHIRTRDVWRAEGFNTIPHTRVVALRGREGCQLRQLTA